MRSLSVTLISILLSLWNSISFAQIDPVQCRHIFVAHHTTAALIQLGYDAGVATRINNAFPKFIAENSERNLLRPITVFRGIFDDPEAYDPTFSKFYGDFGDNLDRMYVSPDFLVALHYAGGGAGTHKTKTNRSIIIEFQIPAFLITGGAGWALTISRTDMPDDLPFIRRIAIVDKSKYRKYNPYGSADIWRWYDFDSAFQNGRVTPNLMPTGESGLEKAK